MNLPPTLLALPVAIPLVAAALEVVLQLTRSAHRTALQQLISWVALSANLLVALLLLVETLAGHRLAYQMGLWPAPFGITVYADALTALMLTIVGLLALLILPYAMASMDASGRGLATTPWPCSCSWG